MNKDEIPALLTEFVMGKFTWEIPHHIKMSLAEKDQTVSKIEEVAVQWKDISEETRIQSMGLLNKEQPSMWWKLVEQESEGGEAQVSREVWEGRAQVSREVREGKELKQAGLSPNGNETLEVLPPTELYVGESGSPLLWLLLISDQQNKERLRQGVSLPSTIRP